VNILIINHYAGSSIHGMEYRPYYLAKEWVKLGHKVTIVAASFSHLHSKPPEVKGTITEEEIEGIKYVWLKTPAYEGNGAKRVLNMLTFAWGLYKYQKQLAKDHQPNVVIASSPHPFIIFGAHNIAKLAGAKLLFEVRDLWPLTLIELGGISPKHPFIRLMQWAEDYAYINSDRVVSLLPKAYNYMVEHGMMSDKFHYLPNGVNVEEWTSVVKPLPEEHTEVLKSLKEKGHFLIGYAGQHGLANDLYNLIDGAARLQDKAVTFVLVGQGPEKAGLIKKVNEMGLNNVKFLSSIPKTSIPTFVSAMDALYIGLMKEPLFRFGVSPNKLMDYMMAGKPVIHAIEAGNDLVAESGCGISIPSEDPDAIAKAVGELMVMESGELAAMGYKGKEFILANHDYRILAQRFLEGL
jgi:glycosyltransferase involved in cell wall biosynthesis